MAAQAGLRCYERPRARATASLGDVLDERLTVACGEGAVRLVELQRAGRQPMRTEDFLRGTPIAAGCYLGANA